MEATNDQALIWLRPTTHKTGLVKLKNKGPLKKQYCLLSAQHTKNPSKETKRDLRENLRFSELCRGAK